MKKTESMYPVPEIKNNFKTWVNIIRSNSIAKTEEAIPSLKKSLYIRRSTKNLQNSPNKWKSIQLNARDKYLKKIKLMEEIRERKIQNKTENFIYTPRYAYPKVSASK
ncbi:MAG: hypothetical protein LLF83_01610 [Methanobacterium sp.]|nr:hypothetical protein [Methanobacterium sp.]